MCRNWQSAHRQKKQIVADPLIVNEHLQNNYFPCSRTSEISWEGKLHGLP